jgi:D-alanyl-D-alanine carboxypeptidase
VITGKGIAGYMTARDGHDAVFAFYVNFVPADPVTGAHAAGDMLGEIAAAAWESDWGGRK